MNLHLISETTSTLTLGWTPPDGIEWYLFYAGDTRVANGTPTYEKGARKGELRDQVTFSKGEDVYRVVAIVRSTPWALTVDVGEYSTVEPPPPPPPPPPAGDLLFKADFETGNASQWQGALGSGYGGASYAVVTDDPHSGTYCCRHTLAPNTGNYRSEFGTADSPWEPTANRYIGVAIKLPSGFNFNACAGFGCIVGQYDEMGIFASPVSITIGDPRYGVPLNHCHLNITSGVSYPGHFDYSNGPGGNLSTDAFVVPIGEFNTNVWHEIIVGYNRACSATGTVNGWWKRKGESVWNNTVTITGVPTLQRNQGQTDTQCPCHINPGVAALPGCGSVHKNGFYRAASTLPLVAYHDTIVWGTTFDVVAAEYS